LYAVSTVLLNGPYIQSLCNRPPLRSGNFSISVVMRVV